MAEPRPLGLHVAPASLAELDRAAVITPQALAESRRFWGRYGTPMLRAFLNAPPLTTSEVA
jgi:hypothetical protein